MPSLGLAPDDVLSVTNALSIACWYYNAELDGLEHMIEPWQMKFELSKQRQAVTGQHCLLANTAYWPTLLSGQHCFGGQNC